MKIGVLALQGDVREHVNMLNSLDVEPVEVRIKDDLEHLSGLILPGGESTTISRLLIRSGLDKAIQKSNLPLFGTCAGAILLAQITLDRENGQKSLKLIDIAVRRNFYGRQLDSFESKVDVEGIGIVPAVFIRAPVIEKIGKNVKVLARHNGQIVMARNGNKLVSTFHPELSGDNRIHKLFISMCQSF